jgi:hypothetical protein
MLFNNLLILLMSHKAAIKQIMSANQPLTANRGTDRYMTLAADRAAEKCN